MRTSNSSLSAPLGAIGGSYSWAAGINNSGQIVGESGQGGFAQFRAFLYANGQMTDLGTLGGGMSSAACINESGQIAGRSELSSGFFGVVHAFLYSGGRMTDLGTLGGSGSWAKAINASGQVVGASYLSSAGSPVPIYDQHAFLYANSRMADLGTLPPYGSSEANGINASGQVVGEVFDYYASNDPDSTGQRAFVYTGGRMLDLNTLLVGAPGWILLQATAVNDRGAIVGFGLTPAGDTHAFLLTPSTQPLPPVVTTPPATQHVAPDSRVAFSVAVIGSSLTYQWKRNGVAIAGATGGTYEIASATPGDMGFYTVTISNGSAATDSAAAVLTLSAPQTYTFTVLAGATGSYGSADGTGSAARFSTPKGIAVDGAGNLFVGDTSNHTIRKISPAGTVTTVAGTAGQLGRTDGTGAAARFYFPAGVAVDASGNVFVVDNQAGSIRRVSSAGVVTTISAANSGLFIPMGIALDAGANPIIADTGNHTIRRGTPPDLPTSRLMNISTRGTVPAGGALTPGFVLRGSGSKSLLARAVGPTLTRFGVGGALADPALDLIRAGTSTALLANDNWGTASAGPALLATTAAVGAFALDNGSKDAATLATLNTATTGAGYSVRITPANATASGLVLAEVYDADPLTAPVQIVNVSTLGFVGTAAENIVSGFVIGGTAAKQLLIRAVGPALAQFGVTGTLADPQFALIPLGQTFTVASNDNWDGSATTAAAFTRAGAFPLPSGSKDAALVVRLPPGGYTVTVSDGGGGTGTALVEIYDLDP